MTALIRTLLSAITLNISEMLVQSDAGTALYRPVNFETTIQCNVTMSLSVELRRGVDNQAVPATLLSLTSKHAEDFVMRWRWHGHSEGVSQLEEASQEDKFWNWHFKQRISETRDNHEAYAVECEGVTQGLIAIETQQHRSVLAPGEPLVYVARLSSTPWNRRQIQEPPQFRRVGTLLLRFSRIRSLALGYKVELDYMPYPTQKDSTNIAGWFALTFLPTPTLMTMSQ